MLPEGMSSSYSARFVSCVGNLELPMRELESCQPITSVEMHVVSSKAIKQTHELPEKKIYTYSQNLMDNVQCFPFLI